MWPPLSPGPERSHQETPRPQAATPHLCPPAPGSHQAPPVPTAVPPGHLRPAEARPGGHGRLAPPTEQHRPSGGCGRFVPLCGRATAHSTAPLPPGDPSAGWFRTVGPGWVVGRGAHAPCKAPTSRHRGSTGRMQGLDQGVWASEVSCGHTLPTPEAVLTNSCAPQKGRPGEWALLPSLPSRPPPAIQTTRWPAPSPRLSPLHPGQLSPALDDLPAGGVPVLPAPCQNPVGGELKGCWLGGWTPLS